MRIAELRGRRVAIWGYGREGRAALAALRARAPGLDVTVFCSAAEARSIDASFPPVDHAGARTMPIASPPDGAALGAFDVVIRSPGVSRYRPEALSAERGGTRFTSGTAIWFAENPQARVIAVTGTKGKSTVSALIAHLLRNLGARVALAGNIGLPLLELLDPDPAPAWWVVELSSFQARDAGHADVAVVNNIHEEHLDWHGTRERYVVDKLALASVARTLVVNGGQAELLERTAAHPQRIAFGDPEGWHVEGRSLHRGTETVFDLVRSPLPGFHNALNACAALAAIDAAGLDARAAAPAIEGFRPLPHRLQTLGTRERVAYVDDSIATTPQATLEALASLEGRAVIVLVGGFERSLDWRPFAAAVRAAPPRAIVATGANRDRIAATLRAAGGSYTLAMAPTLAEAVAAAQALATSDSVVLLSPGAPSFDAFADYAERGRSFARLAGFDADAIGGIDGLGVA